MKVIAFYLESTEATGGVNRVASIIASGLSDRGYRVHLISRYGGRSGRFTDDKRIVFHELFPRFYSKYLTASIEAMKIRELVISEKIEVLVSTGGTFFAISQFAPAKHIVWDHVSFWHGNPVQQYFRRHAARHAFAIVTLTKENEEAFATIKGAKARTVTIHNPAILVPEKRINSANRIMISVGFLAEQKGYDLLLQAWNVVEPQLRSQWKLWIVGEDEGDKALLERIIARNRLQEVELLGFRSDIPALFSQCSIYVMSSRWEGMPMVLLEAQACGLPVISFDCKTGPAEILTSDCGVLVEAENVEKMAAAMERVMRDEDLRIKLSEGALENVKRFALPRIIDDWVRLIERA